MNHVELIGRLTNDPQVRWTSGENQMCVTNYGLAVDRKDKDHTADFLNITVFGKGAEFAEKYFKKGMKVAVVGSIRTGSYTDRDGKKIYTTNIVASEQEFCEKKSEAEAAVQEQPKDEDGFMNVPEDIDEDLPFARPER